MLKLIRFGFCTRNHRITIWKRGMLYGTGLISYIFLRSLFLCLFWYCHVCRLLKFSYLNPITNPTPLPNATLTIRAAARNPNCWGIQVYPNYRGSRMQP